MENGQEAPRECPVCFERISATERTLACRHVFCHDCLAKLLVVAWGQGCIVCPLCRYITILTKQKETRKTPAAAEGCTQEAPLPFPPGDLQVAPWTSSVGLWRGLNWVARYLRRTSRQVSRQGVTINDRSGSQIFIISGQGRATTQGAVDPAEGEPTACPLNWTDLLCLLLVIVLLALAWLLATQL